MTLLFASFVKMEFSVLMWTRNTFYSITAFDICFLGTETEINCTLDFFKKK